MNLHKALIANEIFGDGGSGGGSSDFSTAEVTFIGATGLELNGATSMIDFTYQSKYYMLDDEGLRFIAGQPTVIPIGSGAELTQIMAFANGAPMENAQFSASGNAEVTSEGINITGDCTITVSAGGGN